MNISRILGTYTISWSHNLGFWSCDMYPWCVKLRFILFFFSFKKRAVVRWSGKRFYWHIKLIDFDCQPVTSQVQYSIPKLFERAMIVCSLFLILTFTNWSIVVQIAKSHKKESFLYFYNLTFSCPSCLNLHKPLWWGNKFCDIYF